MCWLQSCAAQSLAGILTVAVCPLSMKSFAIEEGMCKVIFQKLQRIAMITGVKSGVGHTTVLWMCHLEENTQKAVWSSLPTSVAGRPQ